MAIEISSEFSWVLIVAALQGLQLILIGFSIPRKLFSKEFFADKFPKVDYKRFRGGYPDMGNGRFAAGLEFEDWVSFNNAQRAHYNYIERYASVVVAELGCGLFFPRLAVLAGVVYIIGRALYTGGYKFEGPRGRRYGVAICEMAYFPMLFGLIYGGFIAGGGVAGLLKLVTGGH